MTLSIPDRRSFYEDAHVQRRIAEFFGGTLPDAATAVYFAVGTEESSNPRERLPLEDLQSWMRLGPELHRSLWDRDSLLAHLDVEYVNFDHPSASFLDATRIFQLQAPVVAEVKKALESFGIHPLHLITGRGHHFVWRVTQRSAAFARLEALGHMSASLQRLYAAEHAPTGESVGPQLGAAFAGLGLVMEFLAQRVKAAAAPHCEVPVELAAIEIEYGAHGREMIAVDITEYADPLCSRVARVPFSVYLKPSQSRGAIGEELFEKIPPIFVVPLGKLGLAEALRVRSDPDAVRGLAAEADARIPDASAPMKHLIKACQNSPLARIHQHFYAEQHDAPSMWPETYDRMSLEGVPACVRSILENPNDRLLRPGCVQRVVRILLSAGWHPRHIAGLIRSKYERDYRWGEQWRGYDPATRADFFARVFSAEHFTGADDLADFKCRAAREDGLCFIEECAESRGRTPAPTPHLSARSEAL